MEEESKKVDYVLVWEECLDRDVEEDKKIRKMRQSFQDNLKKKGLHLEEEKDEESKLMFVKIRASHETLLEYAEKLKYRMPLKKMPDDMRCLCPSPRDKVSLIKACCGPLDCLRVSPNRYAPRKKAITAVYSNEKEYLFDMTNNETEFFTSSRRARIIYFILRRNPYAEETKDCESEGKSDDKLGINNLLKNNAYLAAYPLHDGNEDTLGTKRHFLSQEWGSFKKCLKYQPLFEIKEYFGIQIALYFAWLGFYTRMLIPAAIVGIFCFLYGASTLGADVYSNDVCDKGLKITMCPLCDNCTYWRLHHACFHAKLTHLFDNETTLFFATFMSIWTAVFLVYWKQYDSKLMYQWDLTGFDVKDQYPRPEYLQKNVRKTKVNPFTRKDEPDVSFLKHKLPYTLLSFSTVTLLICLAVAAVISVVVYRITLKLMFNKSADQPGIQSKGTLVVTFTAAMLNLLFIMFFNWLYEGVAEKLTEWEFHRTQYEFDDSYTFKVYLLQFVNYYSSIIYLAFFKGIYVGSPNMYIKLFGKWRQEECKIGCMPELCIQLAVVMIGKQLKSSIAQLIVPAYKNWKRNSKWKRLKNDPNKQWVNDFKLIERSKRGLIDEYIEMVIQYGFVTIFVTAFPLAPFFALLNNIFEVRLDAKKLIHYQRRPIPLRVKDIGVWYPIMEFIGKFSILSNAFIIAITSKFIPKFVYRFNVFGYEYLPLGNGTLQGFLNHSLAFFNTSDLDPKPEHDITEVIRTPPVETCRYPAYRHSYYENVSPHYKPNDFYWRVWLARVLFILLFQNIVSTIVILIRWIIPDIPQSLKDTIDCEEHLTNDHIINLVEIHKSDNNPDHDRRDSITTMKSNISHLMDDVANTIFNYIEMNETSKRNTPSPEEEIERIGDNEIKVQECFAAGEILNSIKVETETEKPIQNAVEEKTPNAIEGKTQNSIEEKTENAVEEKTEKAVEEKKQNAFGNKLQVPSNTYPRAENVPKTPMKGKRNAKKQINSKQKSKMTPKKQNTKINPVKEKSLKTKKNFFSSFCK